MQIWKKKIKIQLIIIILDDIHHLIELYLLLKTSIINLNIHRNRRCEMLICDLNSIVQNFSIEPIFSAIQIQLEKY